MAILPDYLRAGLDLVFCGINPGTKSASTGHHYAGPGNHFWPLLHESGLITEPLAYAEDARILEWGIGLTNMVARSSPSISDLSLEELREGATVFRRKLLTYRPKIVCFNGKRIYEVFAGHPCSFGTQTDTVGRTAIYVMPSTSARTASHQRADKLKFFLELRELVDRVKQRTVV
ncbi:MAG: mismatch-specific DNA-glycosylase [Chloroflexota bacterium]|nr:mismatch-specific DNA-glycosylase [Chloroflexota bacterium]